MKFGIFMVIVKNSSLKNLVGWQLTNLRLTGYNYQLTIYSDTYGPTSLLKIVGQQVFQGSTLFFTITAFWMHPLCFFNHFVHAFIKNTLIIGKFSPWTNKTKQLFLNMLCLEVSVQDFLKGKIFFGSLLLLNVKRLLTLFKQHTNKKLD